MAYLYPFPSSPSKFSAGILMSSKLSAQVDDALIPSYHTSHRQLVVTANTRRNAKRTFFSRFIICTPISFSTRKHVIPLYPLDGSALAKT